MTKIRIAIIGATGYTGAELIRTLLQHPQVEIRHLTSESSAGKWIGELHASLACLSPKTWITEPCNVAEIAPNIDLAFLCLPHTESAKIAKQFLDRKIKVIDLSADFRLKSALTYQKWYKGKHPHPELLKHAIYGLPELHRQYIRKAQLIANPGCYATAAILSAVPLVQTPWINLKSLIIDAKSGISGAGKKTEARYLFCESTENFLAYGVTGHKHIPEIEQELTMGDGQRKVQITFIPHLLPIQRGILVTLYADLKKTVSAQQIWKRYSDFYKNEPFVQILPLGKFPELKSVQASNYCQIGVHVNELQKKVIVIGVIDNLGKGASQQAIQNMNLMFGIQETCGLTNRHE